VIILFTAWTWIDPIISLVIVAVIVVGTWQLLTDSLNLALDAVPKTIEPRAVTNTFRTAVTESVTLVGCMIGPQTCPKLYSLCLGAVMHRLRYWASRLTLVHHGGSRLTISPLPCSLAPLLPSHWQ
jgi:hypothetical protein